MSTNNDSFSFWPTANIIAGRWTPRGKDPEEWGIFTKINENAYIEACTGRFCRRFEGHFEDVVGYIKATEYYRVRAAEYIEGAIQGRTEERRRIVGKPRALITKRSAFLTFPRWQATIRKGTRELTSARFRSHAEAVDWALTQLDALDGNDWDDDAEEGEQ